MGHLGSTISEAEGLSVQGTICTPGNLAIKLSKHDLQVFSKVATVDLEKGCTAGVFHPAVIRSIANSL
jgi:hypothetical protein